MEPIKRDFDLELRVCNCNNLLVAIRESEQYYEKDGLVFNKETGECLGTIYQLYNSKFQIA